MSIKDDLAIKLGKNLAEYSDNEDAEDKLIYLMKRFVNNLIWLSSLFIISNILDIKLATFVFLSVFVPLRSRFGGSHVKSDYLCIALSTIIPVLAGYISYSININIAMVFIAYIFAYAMAFIIGVVDNPNKRLSTEKKATFKKQGIIILNILVSLHICTILSNKNVISNAITLAIITAFTNLLKRD